MHSGALCLRLNFSILNRRKLGVDLRIDLGNDGFKIKQQYDTILHLDDTYHAGLIADLWCRLHILPGNAMDTGYIVDEETDIIVIDFRHDDIFWFLHY